MREVILFLICFLAPFVHYRTLFFIARKKFDRPLKAKGMQVHHLHYGLVLIFAGAIALLFADKNIWIIALLGLGLGLVFDEFIGSLRIPEDRPAGILIYRNSFKETLVLFLTSSLLILVAALIYFRGA